MADHTRNEAFQECVFRCGPDVEWSVEVYRVVLLNHRTGAVLTLGSRRAAIWDLISRGRSHDKLIRELGVIASMNAADAAGLIEETVEDLVKAGFLVPGSGFRVEGSGFRGDRFRDFYPDYPISIDVSNSHTST